MASHSPQVDPILDELSDGLADLSPRTPEIPYYSATEFDPREEPCCDAGYWVDNLRRTVLFGAAVRAALEDGFRVFAELAPHPLLTHAVGQTAGTLEIPIAAVAGMRREQSLPHGLRGLLGDLHDAGAAVDFSVLYPGGHLVDAPLPAWAHRRLLLARDDAGREAHAANSVAVHPLLGSHVRLMEEPERHAWQGEVGTAALPWLGDHQIHNVPALPGAAYCEMALAAARTVLGEKSEVRNIRFDEMLLLDEKTPIGAVASLQAPGIATFVVETDQHGEKVRRVAADLHAADDDNQPSAHDLEALLTAHPCRLEGDELRARFHERGVQFGPAFSGLAAAHVGEETSSTVLAEVALHKSIRTQQAGYGVHPALLDACFQSVAAHPAVQQRQRRPVVAVVCAVVARPRGGRSAHYCYTKVAACGADVEADIDVMDEHDGRRWPCGY